MSDNPLEPRQPTLLDRRREGVIPRQRKQAAFWRMLRLIRPHRRTMIWGVILGFGVALTYATSLAGIYPVLQVVVEKQDIRTYLANHAAKATAEGKPWAPIFQWASGMLPQVGNSDEVRIKTLLVLLGSLVAVNLIGNLFRVFAQYLVLYATHRTMMDLRRRMYHKALRLPMTAVSGDLSGTVNQFMSDTREIFLGITTLFGKVAREPLKAICVLVIALYVDAKLTLVTLAIAPPAVLLLWYFGRKVRKATMKLLGGYGLMLGALEETLQGVATVKGYAREGLERHRMWRLERGMLKQQLKLSWIEAISSPLIEVVGILVAVGGIVWLANRVINKEIEPSQFMMMVALLAAMLDPIRKVANVYNMVQRSGAASDRVFRFLDQPEERTAGPMGLWGAVGAGPASLRARFVTGAEETASLRARFGSGAEEPASLRARFVDAPAAAPKIEFADITFRYTPGAPAAVANASLTVKPGECIAVVGPNGSGKSTLLRLLPRLLELQEGRIAIDGAEVRAISLRALRRGIAIVDQRPVIFARTVRENLAYGKPEATLEEVRAAAQKAYAAEFIEAWPQQYETEMGEFGATISGGQRQRIAIARAFLKPASILIFDEATSEIDAESERKIHEALNLLRRGKTTFLIAHRHTVMDMAERIVVMDAGRIIDVGTHDELIGRCPLYVGLYRSPGA